MAIPYFNKNAGITLNGVQETFVPDNLTLECRIISASWSPASEYEGRVTPEHIALGVQVIEQGKYFGFMAIKKFHVAAVDAKKSMEAFNDLLTLDMSLSGYLSKCDTADVSSDIDLAKAFLSEEIPPVRVVFGLINGNRNFVSRFSVLQSVIADDVPF